MRRITLLAVLLTACAHVEPTPAPSPPNPTITDARQAASNTDFALAHRLFASVAANAADPKDREAAEIAMANIVWRIDTNPVAARARLVRIGTRDAFVEQSRMERELGRYAEAESLARKAVALSTKPDDLKTAQFTLARALILGHVSSRLNGTPAPSTNLREGFDIARSLVSRERGRLASSLLLLDSALLIGDGGAALDAWRSYYGSAAQSAILAPVAATLERLLREWHGGASSEIAAALASSRMFDEAMLAGANGEIAIYDAYLHRVKTLTDSYYRDLANRRAQPRAYRNAFRRETERVYAALNLPWDRDALDNGADTALGKKFGTLIALGQTGAVLNLHMGHRVVDENRPVSQYGKDAKVRFIQIDSIISNGYESWAWDGNGQHGGWGKKGLIVQVRPAYAEAGLFAWSRLTDPALRADFDEKIAKESEEDWKRAAKTDEVFLPGLAGRMVRNDWQSLRDELQARGLTGEDLRAAFIAELGRRTVESSIFAHEGRHAIDAQYKPVPAPQSEYQAKLSEIAFAPDPRLAFTGGILASSIGSQSPHGIANARIMKGYAGWMRAHPSEIAGFDASRPALPQLDKLTDDQMRAVARSLDPYAGAR
jgi:hypothetical protein